MTTNNSDASADGYAAEALPLSFPQERMFLLDQIMPGIGAYNVPTLVSVPRTLDPELLRAAFARVVERHHILRTRLLLRDGEPAQAVFDAPPFALSVSDLRDRSRSDAIAAADEIFAELAGRPFNLGGDVLLRAALVHLAPDEDRLMVVFQHMGSDHASGGLLFAELDAIYTALESGGEPELPELEIQYADFAAGQRASLTGSHLAELCDYWTTHLGGAPERLDLPSDRPRPRAQTYRGSWLDAAFAPTLSEPLHELARAERASPFMVLLAGFAALIHRYTGVEDVVIGTPVSGRHDERTAPLLGFFSNTLALRIDLSGDPTFSELLARVRETLMGALAYQELPFEKVVELVNPDRARSHSPVFQVLFGYDRGGGTPGRLGGVPVQRLPIPGWQWSRFDLSIIVHDRSDGSMLADVGYSTELFDAPRIERMLGHLEEILAGGAAAATTPVSKLPLLTDAERERFAAWNATERAYDRRCLHELISEQADRVPQNVAVRDGAQQLTYAELEQRANQLARELAAQGAAPGRLVGICLDRSLELVVAMLATLKTGAAYVPIEPTYPPQRQEYMLADAAAAVLVTQERYLGVVEARGAALLCLDRPEDHARISAQPLTAPPPGPASDPEQLAYVIYTSGSTGQPKGVEVTHRSVANLVAHMRSEPGLTATDVVANITTPAFDLSVPDWYLTLTTGAQLALIPREATQDGVALADWLARVGATFMQATPTTWQLLIDTGWRGNPALKIVCGGEALPRALAGELISRGHSLWHMYGPTETTVWSSIHQLHAADPELAGPIANTTFMLLDTHDQVVPVGVPGELLIGGEGLARGYHERVELTAERFATVHGARHYRTGDLVRFTERGTLEFLGRIDHQVKLRGFRIELEEIEAVLDTHHAINGSVAIVREDEPGDQRLIAYVVPSDPEQAPGAEELRRLLRAKLPPFMVPSAFVMLEAFPVTANGKLDRRGLPAPNAVRTTAEADYVAPETPIEEQLAAVWGDVLGLERVGIDDDFFDIGGHSLLAVRMLARVQESLGVELALGSVFDHPTVRALAAEISGGLLAGTDDAELAALLAELEAGDS